MSTSAPWIWNVGIRSASTMITSGAPVPAEMAVWNLSYSSLPWPTLVQQTCTSSCCLLKLSTTSWVLGYQPHIVTTGTFCLVMVFVQLLASLPPSSEEQATRPVPAASMATVASIRLLFIEMVPFGDGGALHPCAGGRHRGQEALLPVASPAKAPSA
jgi:hypothetical protein